MMAERRNVQPGIPLLLLGSAIGVVGLTFGDLTLAQPMAGQGRLVAYQPLPEWTNWDT
jgi:hypothetical protein